MPAYGYSAERIEAKIRRSRRVKLWLVAILVPIAIADLFLQFHWPGVPVPYRRCLDGVFIACFVLAMPKRLFRRRTSEWVANFYRSFHISVAPDSITMAAPPHYSRSLEMADTVRAEEPAVGGGLYVRGKRRYQWLLVPRDLDGYPEIRNLLPLVGIPVVATRVPPNMEEFLCVAALSASILCDLFAHSTAALAGNLFLSLGTGVFGVVVIRSGWPPISQRKVLHIGCFLPFVFALIAFLWR